MGLFPSFVYVETSGSQVWFTGLGKARLRLSRVTRLYVPLVTFSFMSHWRFRVVSTSYSLFEVREFSLPPFDGGVETSLMISIARVNSLDDFYSSRF